MHGLLLCLVAFSPAQTRDSLYIADPLPSLEAESHPAPGAPATHVAERVSFRTQFGLRLPAILYLPRNVTGKVPAIVSVNGAGTGFFREGAALLAYDLVIAPRPPLTPRQEGLHVVAVLQAFAYLGQRPEIDRAHISAVGPKAMAAACDIEPRLESCTAGEPAGPKAAMPIRELRRFDATT
ncbi:MAG: hypothetical protein ACRD44_02585, partial [Bryobacteraceae bacterium]